MNMKRNILILALAAVVSLFASCSTTFDDSEIWDAIEELKAQITSFVTVIQGEDGVYYWAVCKDGKPVALEVDGKKVPVTVTPSFQISKDNTWMVSLDGGASWTDTGIPYSGTSGSSAVFFQNVVHDGGYLIITLSDGTVVKIKIHKESTFKAASDTLWFSRAGMEKYVSVEMDDIQEFTITEKPEGWKVTLDEGYLYAVSPKDFSAYPDGGTVKVLGIYEGGTPDILSVELVYEPMFAMSFVNGEVVVTMSEHTGEDFNGYALKGWRKEEFNLETAVASFNADPSALEIREGSAAYALSDIIPDYQESDDYIVVGVPYLPVSHVGQGTMQYTAQDVQTVTCKGNASAWKIYNVRYDSATLKAVIEDKEFYGGFFELADWNNYGRDNFLETLRLGDPQSYTIDSYEGPANAFPSGEVDEHINPATDYVVWYLPVKSPAEYAADDFVTYSFKTPDVTYDSSIAAPTAEIMAVTVSGFTANVTPAAGAYKTYSAILKAAALPGSDAETVKYLIDVNNHTRGQYVNTVTTSSFESSDEVYLLAVTLTEDGRYGAILKEQVEIAELEFTDDLGVEVIECKQGVGSVTLSLSFKGDVQTITYMAESYTFFDDATLQKLMALGQIGDAVTRNVAAVGNSITLHGLSLGTEYTFYAVVRDNGNKASKLYTYTFTPSSDIDYVLSGSEGYDYGMPQLSGTCSGGANSYTLTLSVDMPSSCVKYWLFKGNYEYFTGDPWTDSDKLVNMQYEGVTVHEDSISGKKYTYMNSTSRIYMVWLDDKGDYHAIYEFNPRQ